MDQYVQLELEAGGYAELTLPPPAECTSFYVFAMEDSGRAEFWQLLTRLMATAGRPICDIHAIRGDGAAQVKFTRSAWYQLLRRPGYGFGIFLDIDPALKDLVVADNQKLLFVRDPRDLIFSMYLRHNRQQPATTDLGAVEVASGALSHSRISFSDFLQTPDIGRVVQRYRRYAELWHAQRDATLMRYEHALPGWHAMAAEIVATVKLPIEYATATSIAAIASPVGDRLPDHKSMTTDILSRSETAELEAGLAELLAAFGYVPRSNSNARPALAPARGADLASPVVQRVKLDVQPPAGDSRPAVNIYEYDPVLYSRLKPNALSEMRVLGRRVVMDVDAAGCRPVTGQRASGSKTFAAYGCSFTYGVSIPADETFCSLLQGMFPEWRVENHGVGGYGTLQNLLQLERESRWSKADFVTFCWISHHLLRNLCEVSWLQDISRQHPQVPKGAPERRRPRAGLGPDGALQVRSVRFPRHDLVDIDLSDFASDQHYQELVYCRILERAKSIVTGYGGHFFVTTLAPGLSSGLAVRLADAGIPVVDAALRGDEYNNKPDDAHPNGLANQIYAGRIRDYLLQISGRQADRASPTDVATSDSEASLGVRCSSQSA